MNPKGGGRRPCDFLFDGGLRDTVWAMVWHRFCGPASFPLPADVGLGPLVTSDLLWRSLPVGTHKRLCAGCSVWYRVVWPW